MPLRNATREVIEQVVELINVVDEHYNQTPASGSSPIGRHVRHIVDHLWAFQSGLESGCIDYNQRHRDTIIEDQPQSAIEALEGFCEWLSNALLHDEEITVISEISVSHCESKTVVSNFPRELAYLINHTMHHLAYANLLAKTMAVEIPEHIGIAPATATYLRQQTATSQPVKEA